MTSEHDVEEILQKILMELSLPLLFFSTLSGCVTMEDSTQKYQICPTPDVQPLVGTPTALQERFQTLDFWDHLIRHGSNRQLSEMIKYAEYPDFKAKSEYIENARSALKYRADHNCQDVPNSPRI